VTRHLQCGSNPWVVLKYLSDLHSQRQQKNWLLQIKELCDGIHGNRLTHTQIQEYELLDHKISAGKLQAEWNHRNLKMNQVPWSPSLMKAIYWVLYWKGVLVKANGHQIGTSVLHSQVKKGGISHELEVIHCPEAQIEANLSRAYQ